MKHEMTEADRKRALALIYAESEKKYKNKPPRAHPFREGSMIWEGFEMCRSDKGATAKQLDKLCRSWGSNMDHKRLLRWYRREMLHGCTWTFTEKGTTFRIEFTPASPVEVSKRKK